MVAVEAERAGAEVRAGAGEKRRRPTATIIADQVLTVEEAARKFVRDVGLQLGNGGTGQVQARFESVVALLRNYPGQVPVFFHLETADQAGRPVVVSIQAGDKLGVRPAPELLVGLRQILSPGAVRVSGEGTLPQKAPAPAWRQRK